MNTIRLSDIKIPKSFLNSNTKDSKVLNAIKYIKAHGKIDKPIILNKGVLVDNYARYLAANIERLYEVPYVELQHMTYIIGKFRNGNRRYMWKNDKNIDIQIGDDVVVKVQGKDGKTKKAIVTVVGVFVSDNLRLYNKHKSVVKKLNKINSDNC